MWYTSNSMPHFLRSDFMPLIFIKYILPVLIIIIASVYLSFRSNKFLGLIPPFISLVLTGIFMYNALDWIGILVAFSMMLIPNIITFGIYFIVRKVKKSQDEEIIRLKFSKFKKK